MRMDDYSLAVAKESIRELRFKVRSQSLLLEYALKHLPASERNHIGGALFRLAISHTRGEHPLSFLFHFDGEDRQIRED